MGVVAALRITAWVYLVPVLVDWWFRVEKSWKVKLGNLTMLGVLSVGGWLAGHPDAYFRGVFGEYLGNYFKFFTKSSFDWVGGDTSNGVPNYVWWFKYLNYTGLFATMFGLFAGSYVWSLVRVKKFMRERSWFYLGVLLAIGLYFTALMIRSVKFDRHFVPLTPLVAIVSGYGLWQTKVWLVNIFKQWGKLILSMVLLLIFGFPLIRSLLFVYQIGLIDTRPAAMEWVMDNYGKDQVIISSGEANIITQNLQKHGYRKVVNFFPIVKYEELGEQVSGGLFLITSWDYRVCENYQKVKQMRDCWQAYQRIKEKFELLKQFAPPVVDGRLFGLDELELSSTVNAYHNPVVEVYRITADM